MQRSNVEIDVEGYRHMYLTGADAKIAVRHGLESILGVHSFSLP
jgi:hypothetical protein